MVGKALSLFACLLLGEATTASGGDDGGVRVARPLILLVDGDVGELVIAGLESASPVASLDMVSAASTLLRCSWRVSSSKAKNS